MKTLLLVLLVLVGCGSNPVTQEMKIPIPVPCVTEMPRKPDYRTPKLPENATDFDKVMALLQDWVNSRKYEGLLEAGLQACARAH